MSPCFKSFSLAALLLVAAMTTGCAIQPNADVYGREEILQTVTVDFGTVTELRTVQLTGEISGIGLLVGSALGSGLAAQSKHPANATAQAFFGGIFGAVVGAAIEERFTRGTGVEATVQIDNGMFQAVVLEQANGLSVGDRVKVVRSMGRSRLLRVNV